MQINLNIESNLGYAADQINTRVTLADLLDEVQAAIEEWGDEAEVVIHQTNNRYGANFGRIPETGMFERPEADGDN